MVGTPEPRELGTGVGQQPNGRGGDLCESGGLHDGRLGGQVIRTAGRMPSGLMRSTWMVSLDPLMAPLANGVMGEDVSTAGFLPVEPSVSATYASRRRYSCGDSKPLNYDELERWTRVGYERRWDLLSVQVGLRPSGVASPQLNGRGPFISPMRTTGDAIYCVMLIRFNVCFLISFVSLFCLRARRLC